MKISKVIETIDNVRIDELYELIKMGFINSFTSEEEIVGKDGRYKGIRDCKQLDPEANETEGLDWYSSLSKEERVQLKKMYKALMKKNDFGRRSGVWKIKKSSLKKISNAH